MANRLYGLTFEEIPDAPKYHPDVKVYDVKDEKGEHLAVFMTDYFTRPSKRQGAWMEELKTSWVNPDGTVERPIITMSVTLHLPQPMPRPCSPSTTSRPCSTNSATAFTECSRV